MLYIRYGSTEKTIYQFDFLFDANWQRSWFKNQLLRDIVKDIDKSIVTEGTHIESPVLGTIGPLELSSGTKALALMLFHPEYEYSATHMGDNCAKWIIKISQIHYLQIAVDRGIEFAPPEAKNEVIMDAINVNTGKPIKTMMDFVDGYIEWKLSGGGDSD